MTCWEVSCGPARPSTQAPRPPSAEAVLPPHDPGLHRPAPPCVRRRASASTPVRDDAGRHTSQAARHAPTTGETSQAGPGHSAQAGPPDLAKTEQAFAQLSQSGLLASMAKMRGRLTGVGASRPFEKNPYPLGQAVLAAPRSPRRGAPVVREDPFRVAAEVRLGLDHLSPRLACEVRVWGESYGSAC